MEFQYSLVVRLNRSRDHKAGWQLIDCESLSDLSQRARHGRFERRVNSMVAVRSDGATLTLGDQYDDDVWERWMQDAIAALRVL